MLSDFKSATIIQACIRSATIMNISCIAYLIWNFSPLLGILIMWEMVWVWLITGLITWLINAGINVVRLQFIADL